jgi:hypothetical protein
MATCVLGEQLQINLQHFSYVTVMLKVAFKICQQIQNSSWRGDFALFRSLPLKLTEVSRLAAANAFVRYAVKIFLYSAQTASVSQNSAKLHLPLQIGCHTQQENSSCLQSLPGRDSSVSIATRYGLDGPGIESWWGAKLSAPVHTGPGAHPAS